MRCRSLGTSPEASEEVKKWSCCPQEFSFWQFLVYVDANRECCEFRYF